MQKYNDQMNKAEQNTKELGKASDGLGTAMKGLFTLALVQQVSNYVGEMVKLGTEANATEARFRALTETMGEYDETMGGLRKATLGAVDDMTLQSGALLLIQTTGIKTNEELQRMMNLIVQTKKPSEDMTTAINNFGLMLANNSILRLDSFGISASKVRLRIEELKSELGVDRSTAFRMAVLEEGEKNIRKFGDAADVASTASSRFATKMTNAAQDIAQAAATGFEGWFLFFDYIDKKAAHDKEQLQELATTMSQDLLPASKELSDLFSGRWGEVDMMGMEGVGSTSFILNFTQEAIAAAQKNPALLNDIDAFREFLFERMTHGSQEQMNELLAVGDSGIFSGMVEAIVPMLDKSQALRDVAESTADVQLRLRDIISDQNSLYVDQQKYIDEVHRKSQEAADAAQFAADRQNVILSTYMGALGVAGEGAMSAAFSMNGQASGDTGVPEYLTQGQADAVGQAAAQARMLADNMKAASEAEEGLFTDEQVERADAYAGQLEDMADNAQDAADAFKNMSLDEMLGRDGGGRLGEELDTVLEKMKALGAEAYQLQNAGDAFDLASGRESWMGKAFDEQIATSIAQSIMGGGMTEHMAAAILKEFDAVMAGAQLQGTDINNPQFQSMMTSTFTNPSFNPDTFNPDEFLAGFSPAATAAQTISDALVDTGTVSGDISSNMDLAVASADLFAGSMIVSNKQAEGIVGNVATIGTELEKVSKTTTKIPIQLEWVNPNGVWTMILPMFVQMMTGTGGVAPGSNTQASSSGPMVRQG